MSALVAATTFLRLDPFWISDLGKRFLSKIIIEDFVKITVIIVKIPNKTVVKLAVKIIGKIIGKIIVDIIVKIIITILIV